MDERDVPADFPQEFLSAVPGAQPKLLLYRTSDGRYIDESAGNRFDRWAWCVDLLEQLVDLVRERVPVPGSRPAYVERVVPGVMNQSFRSTRGISIAEAEWICKQLRTRIEAHEHD